MTVINPPHNALRDEHSIVPVANPPSTAVANQPQALSPQVAAPSLDNPAALKAAFGDSCNWQTLAKKLQTLIEAVNKRFPSGVPLEQGQNTTQFAAEVVANLRNSSMTVCENSTFYRQQALTVPGGVSLETFLQGSGLALPATWAALFELNQIVTRRAQVHPLGNFSGAQAWPIPLSVQAQQSIIGLLQSSTTGLAGLPLADAHKGVLGYLLSGSSVTEADLRAPSVAVEKLLGSPKAQALGKAIQAKLEGFSSDSSVNAYLLAAIQLGLAPESLAAPARTTVAGFDLAQDGHWGRTAATVIESLGRHLLEKGRVTTQTADLGARLLLAKSAPQLLVKGIPPSVTYGSLTWVQLAIATARIEADSPGRALNLDYAQVLTLAEQLDTPEPVLRQAQQNALTDWGVANGLLNPPAPTDTEYERVKTAYNSQLAALKTANTLAQTPIPSRREMALDALKQAFPELDPTVFEAPTLHKAFLIPGRPGRFPGMQSMLDIVMHGGQLGPNEHWVSQDSRIPITSFCQRYAAGKLDVSAAFKSAYDQAITSIEAGQQGLAKYLMSTLPPQDRQNLELGQLEFFHTNDYTLAMDMTSKPTLTNRGHTLQVKTTRGGEVNIYEIDTRNATIKQQNYLRARYTPPYTEKNLHHRNANVVSKTVVLEPFKNTPPSQMPSTRSDYIAQAFAKSLDLRNDDLLQLARGVTSFDEAASTSKAIGEFFLNLIPLRSAIVNFKNGNVADGLFDLSLDFIGLVTLGAGKAAQAGKALSKGFSSVRGAARAARFIGATAIEAVNPLSGAGDLALGGARLAVAGMQRVLSKGLEAVNALRGASGSYHLLKAVSKQHDAAATGAFKVAGERVEGGAVLHNGQWYAFDTATMRAYGSPLDDFTAYTHAVEGVAGSAYVEPGSALSNALFRPFNVPDATIKGISRNSQGVYVAADGHSSYIRHTDSAGQTAVYEVRQVTRGEDGAVQARIYHNNRQTELLVQHVEGDQWQRLGALGGVYINADHLRAWEALPVVQQQKITVQGFAKQHRLNPPTWAHFVQADGRLSAAGIIVRDRAAGTALNAIKPAHLRDWQGMTQQARDAMTMEGFAGVHNLSISDFKAHVLQTGNLAARGEALLFTAGGGTYNTLTDGHLWQWHQLVQQPGNRVTPAAFRRQHNLSPVTWTAYVYIDGSLSPAGLRRSRGTPAGVTVQPPTSLPTPGPSRKRPASDPLDPVQEEPLDLTTPKAPAPAPVVPPVIKLEPDAPPLRTLGPHQVDNSLPILQDPSNPKLSLTQALEGPIDDIRISNWNGLLDGLGSAQKTSVGNRIKASIKDWLRSEGNHGAKFDEAMEVITPLDDGGPARGASVWARRDIPQFEVLGPYSGKYHASEASLFEEQRKQGSRAVLTYLFGTRSGSRSVSALNTGNTLSLINTSQLRNGPAWQANNVASISVGKNLTFYVSLKDIKAGDELLVDYGPFYNPVPDIAIKLDPDA
ncbi:SET domain-containing protein-lysine N-methyltransferase [Pseudomonas sp. 18175]|uniref:SET domain-containing protein-lysine N-methyltransferase n=1 Tax=Pseudomonas sp. 18175 TaxID=3390056 RepID=UPI003D22BA03